MTELEQIQSSIEGLSSSDFARLRDWLDERDARLFDEKIERDAKTGKLDRLIENVRANAQSGKSENSSAQDPARRLEAVATTLSEPQIEALIGFARSMQGKALFDTAPPEAIDHARAGTDRCRTDIVAGPICRSA